MCLETEKIVIKPNIFHSKQPLKIFYFKDIKKVYYIEDCILAQNRRLTVYIKSNDQKLHVVTRLSELK